MQVLYVDGKKVTASKDKVMFGALIYHYSDWSTIFRQLTITMPRSDIPRFRYLIKIASKKEMQRLILLMTTMKIDQHHIVSHYLPASRLRLLKLIESTLRNYNNDLHL